MHHEENSTEDILFFDTYAFFEVIKSNTNYEKYMQASIITTQLNLFELYHCLLQDLPDRADELFETYYQFIVEFDETTIQEAAKMRRDLNKRHVSMTDCIGHVLAKTLGIQFLTGDKEFEHLDNVEFVK